ncbi:hypothetical protein DB88DRAFT_486232 [Papiliotrema laurentii]|uniref:N-acetyltransferase domain-containing protein n=1 Tax=Papiliotrema laurentii TaxID=5418 RepID=A0AAD9FR17_PAPLA|nr:hypothetical protein DB88DRAFT_486232 [Papiliotrema laurentii]
MSVPEQTTEVVIAKLPSRPSPEQVEQCVSILLDAFNGDPIVDAISGFNPPVWAGLLKHRIGNGEPDWETYVATVNGHIQGVALVIPPGKGYPEDPDEFTSQLDPKIFAWQKKTLFPSMTTLDTLSFGPHGIRDPLYLNFLAVSPAARKFGLGSRMLSHLKTVADSQQADFALNSEHAHLCEYYGKRGFEVRGESPVVIHPSGQELVSWGLVNPFSVDPRA